MDSVSAARSGALSQREDREFSFGRRTTRQRRCDGHVERSQWSSLRGPRARSAIGAQGSVQDDRGIVRAPAITCNFTCRSCGRPALVWNSRGGSLSGQPRWVALSRALELEPEGQLHPSDRRWKALDRNGRWLDALGWNQALARRRPAGSPARAGVLSSKRSEFECLGGHCERGVPVQRPRRPTSSR